MIAAPVPVGARLSDSLTEIDASHATALKANGIDGCIRYLHSATPDEVQGIIAAGLGFMPVTFAERFSGPDAVDACKALGIPAGCSVWLDVEGKDAWAMRPDALITLINGWADPVAAAGYMPSLYVGAPQPLTSAQLYALRVVRYWHGQGRCVDHSGNLAEPDCGWCMTQMFPSIEVAGIKIDANMVGQDYHERVPAWAIAG